MISSRSWIALTIATILAVALADIAIALIVDPYGIWRNPVGRKLPIAIFTSGRKAKFLMSKRYIPSNYDGLIIGPSSVANWDVGTLAGAQIYNLSIDGANTTEEKLVLDQALRTGSYKIAILALVPGTTSSHNVRGGLEATTTAESLASFHLYIQEFAYAFRATHHGSGYIDIAPNGHYNFHNRKDLEPKKAPPEYFQIDPVALKQYREMVWALQRHGTSIVYCAPPLFEPYYQLNKLAYQAYVKAILSLLPSAPVINFQAPEYAALRSDPNNFYDSDHLESRGAEKFCERLGTLVPQMIRSENSNLAPSLTLR